jgi:pSer/pThr/pTyr-binding forkhead associated (FHA) protein
VPPKPSDVLAVVSMAEPRIAPFEAEIRKSPFRIGRASDNEGVIPVEPTSGVSGHHCVITLTDGRWYVQDDQSKFGTTVNVQPIPKGKPFNLEDDALLGLGPRLRIRFQIVSSSTPGTPPEIAGR